MPVIFAFADIFLQNGLERPIHGLYLSIFLGVVRGRMTMLKRNFRLYFFHHFIMKVTAMISNNINRDSELGYNLVEYEEGRSITIRFNCRNGLDPLSELFYDHNNVLMPPRRSWVAIHKVHPTW
jgi:hypothetical protein